MEIKVKSVRGPIVRAVVLRTGMAITLRRQTIERGQRGARCLSEPKKRLLSDKEKASRRKDAGPAARPTNPTCDKVLRLFEDEGVPLRNIAERMGFSRATAQSYLNRARTAREMSASP